MTMRWRGWLLLFLGSAGSALAQSSPGAGEILIDATGPDAHHGQSTLVPLPPDGPGRQAFLGSFIQVGSRDNTVTLGGRPISASEFYGQIGRADLVAQAEERARKRIWLMAGGGLTIVAGVVSGLLVMSSGPDTSSPDCLAHGPDVYASCVDRSNKATMNGALLIGAGVALGGAFIVWGIATPQMVTPREETLRLATEYNRDLGRKNGASGLRFQILPSVAAGGARLALRLTF